MKPTYGLALILMASLHTYAQQPSTPGMATFHNPELRLDYTYPWAYSDEHNEQERKRRGEPAEEPSNNPCLQYPIAGMDMDIDFRILALKIIHPECIHRTLKPADLRNPATNTLVDALSSLGKPVIGETLEYTMSGAPAFAIQGQVSIKNAKPKNHPIYVIATCAIITEHLACWTFEADSKTALTTMTSYPIILGDHTPEAVVPSSFIKPDAAAKL
ncbi:MAG: hypothetical protein PW792_09685 [Acidobacteriaceae bacterium]|nr:hypothetical protein [Acidobacteriaceae bacterium]